MQKPGKDEDIGESHISHLLHSSSMLKTLTMMRLKWIIFSGGALVQLRVRSIFY